MNTPSFLIGAALLFWGWQADLLWLGAVFAVALESSRFIHARWEFAQGDLDRLWNLCVLLFFGAFVVAFVANDGANVVTGLVANNSNAVRGEALNKGARSMTLVLLWLPVIVFPITAAQAFSQRERMPLSTFSHWLRRQRKVAGKNGVLQAGSESGAFASGLNVSWSYFAVCLLAASAANEHTWRFAAGLVLLVGWSLWARRSRGFSPVSWTVCMVAAIGLGLAAQSGLRGLQQLMRQLDSALVARFAGGEIGRASCRERV